MRRLTMNWTSEAQTRLKEVPFFVRPAVRKRIEALAAAAGLEAVDLRFYEEARARFGQK
ncbi:MAG: PCP reductase family protein [Chitinophagaceae bacterium]|nr:PCP reductase family protein [Chitinophagaceae bacterium]